MTYRDLRDIMNKIPEDKLDFEIYVKTKGDPYLWNILDINDIEMEIFRDLS